MNHEHDAHTTEQPTETVPGDAVPAVNDGVVHAGLRRDSQGVPSADGTEPDTASEIQQAIERDPQLREALIQGLMASGSLHMSRTEDYSGMIPHPDHWDRFDPGTRERMLRMSEAGTSDESARRDRALDATITETTAGRRNAVLIMLCSLGAALVSVLILRNGMGVTAAGVFLAVPVASVVRDFIKGRR